MAYVHDFWLVDKEIGKRIVLISRKKYQVPYKNAVQLGKVL